MRKLIAALLITTAAVTSAASQVRRLEQVTVGSIDRMNQRASLVARENPRPNQAFMAMTPHERGEAIDQIWGPGPSTAEKLNRFDTFWNYVDAKFAAFQNLDIDWNALRERYRPEIEAGVSRGRFAAIMNQLSLALRDAHTQAVDLDVNVFTVPEPGIPLLAVGAWTFDPTGTCTTALPDGSALIYFAIPDHPRGLERGDRVLGYDGRPWTDLYPELIEEEIPLWPLYWGSAPSSFEHSFVMSATQNWHLFETIDIAKASGQVVHVPTSQMPGPIWVGFCSEQMRIPGIAKPTGTWESDTISYGVMPGTEIGYVYNWAWGPQSEVDFANALYDLTVNQHVESLIIDFRFNAGGILHAAQRGSGILFPNPVPTTGVNERREAADHFSMKRLLVPGDFITDFDLFPIRTRIHESFDGPIALLVGPGAGSAGDTSSLWLTYHPNVRTFGKSTASTFNLPTQPALGTEINLGPDWFARIAEANFFRVGDPHNYLTRMEFPVDEPVWLTQQDVAEGRDTIVTAAVAWLNSQ